MTRSQRRRRVGFLKAVAAAIGSGDDRAPRDLTIAYVRWLKQIGAPVVRLGVVCAWCGKVIFGPIEKDELVSHGMCQSCSDEMEKKQ